VAVLVSTKTVKETNTLVKVVKVKENSMPASSKKKTTQKRVTKINVSLPLELHDWSETLSFEQITDTLFIVGQFLNNDKARFLETDIPRIEKWFEKNEISQFIKAKEMAMIAQEAEMEREIYAREIMAQPYRRPMSH
jgi:hypothetical protein